MFLLCIGRDQQRQLSKAFHNEACSGSFSSRVTTFKIMRAQFFWLTLFYDAYDWVHRCQKCQQFIDKLNLAAIPLRLVVIDVPFQQWGVKFIGPINPHSSKSHVYVLILFHQMGWGNSYEACYFRSHVQYPQRKHNHTFLGTEKDFDWQHYKLLVRGVSRILLWLQHHIAPLFRLLSIRQQTSQIVKQEHRHDHA